MRLDAEICQRALESRDARFDGVFFVGITSTNIYCRPICPARVAYPSRRRFFESAGAAESAGYRPCLRCRPELAPGLALCDAVSQLARAAALRIAGGALNGRSVSELARELSVSDRHLRRAMEREMGVSPVDLAQTHRLLLAKQLLGETALPVTRIAYAAGFQSLRRFNSVFRARYSLNPSAVRRGQSPNGARLRGPSSDSELPTTEDAIHLSLGYRAPFAWDCLLESLGSEAIAGVELVVDGAYARTVCIDGKPGTIVVSDGARELRKAAQRARAQLHVALSPSLLPALMPLLARLRQLFDLDAEPLVVDAHLAAAGLRKLVQRRPGLRVPGAIDGFEIALRTLIGGPGTLRRACLARVVSSLRQPLESGHPALRRVIPDAGTIVAAGETRLRSLGVPATAACAISGVAREYVAGRLILDPSADAAATRRALTSIEGVSERSARAIMMRALHGPDVFPVADLALMRAAGVANARALDALAANWRPWRAYAALHLRLNASAAADHTSLRTAS